MAHEHEREREAHHASLAGIEAGAIPPQDPHLAAAAVVGVIAETLVSPLSPVGGPDTASEEVIVRAIVTFCRRVLGWRGGA